MSLRVFIKSLLLKVITRAPACLWTVGGRREPGENTTLPLGEHENMHTTYRRAGPALFFKFQYNTF